MDKKSELTALAEARACLYRFLGSIYIMEIDERMLGRIKEMKFPETLPESDLQEGYDLIRTCVAESGIDSLEDLAAENGEDSLENLAAENGEDSTENLAAENEVDFLENLAADYAKVFLAAGEAQGLAAFPYESVYTGKRHEFMGDAQQKVKALYAARGWEPKEDMFRIMEDHIGLELEYMAIFCEEFKKAIEDEEKDGMQSVLEEQQSFLKNHLLNWAFSFTSDVCKYAQTDFYRGVAKVTGGFLKLEKQLLDMGGAAWDIE